jgi:hypothetical protein
MLWYKAWRESRVRFFIAFAAVGGITLARVLFVQRLYPGVAHEAPHVHNYLQYIVWTVFGGGVRGMLQLSSLLLGLGGLQRDRKQGTLGFTLALPISRVRLVASRIFVGFAQIVALSLAPPIFIWALSPVVHQSIPLAYGMHYVPFWVLGAMATFCFTFLCSVIFTSEYTALVVGYMVYMFYLAGARYPALRPYPLHIADFMSGALGNVMDRHTDLWTGGFPLPLLCGYLLASVAVLSLSAWITTRQDL